MVESNKIIAEFMGFTNEKNIGWYDNEMRMPQIVYDVQNGNCFDELLFNSSWDWLIPVVEKIESLGYFCMINKWTSVYSGSSLEIIAISTVEGKSKIENTYKACFIFIEWFNKNNQK
jgi:hypothetical protein